MPSREEIAEWLREAATTERALAAACATGTMPLRFMQEAIDRAILFEQRAAQVDAMRCETCEQYEPATDETDDECLHPTMLVRNQCKSFGCFAHEQKPAG